MGMIETKAKGYLNKIKKENGKLKTFLYVNESVIEEAKALDAKPAGQRGRLYGKIIGVKSNVNVRGMPTSCASKTLENYNSTFDASVIEKIKKEDGLVIGMLNMDEFAAGGSGENSAFGCCVNPAAPGRIPGGSSSGSAVAVAAGLCDMALGSDTGGSIRNPASNCGVVGVKPSYGCVSRYGLIDLSMSLDQIGPLANNISDAALLLDVIKGKDERDTKTFSLDKIEIKSPGKIKVGVLKINGVDKRIQKIIDEKTSEVVKKLKWASKEIELKYMDLAVETYYPIVYVEFFSGTRRFDGRRYGKKIEYSCGEEVLRRILGGAEITKAEFEGAYYRRALEVKEIIKEEFEKAFKDVDCILSPVVPSIPWKIGQGAKMKPEEVYAFDALTVPANLAEICAVSLPCGKVKEGKESIPIGIQIMCGKGQEGKMLSIAREIEKI
jgi:aspartyl-tRNA(Asn)/glutamyl-tRNA(Gln) amidotransferase subunit A